MTPSVANDPPVVPILLVDDNAGKRLALRAVLSPLGYDLVEADSGEAALRCVMERVFAVIILDVCMPIMDGFEAAALIRLRRQSEMTPIIFITAYSSDELKQTDRYAEGPVDFMFAPVPPDELRAKVSALAKLFIRAEVLAERAREVQASADQLRLLTDAAPVGIFQTDGDNRYVYTNPRWTELTGMSADEAAGRPWDTIMGAAQRAEIEAGLAGPALHQAELSLRFEIRPTDAPSRIVLLTSKPIPDSAGGSAGWVGTLADVTSEAGAVGALAEARDEATEASRLKSDFLANMSHEIRTPMNGVIGMTDLLLETDLDARQRDYAQTVRNSGEALLTIIDDILDFSKIEAGRLGIEEVDFSVGTIVGDVLDLLAGQAQTKGIELVADIDLAVPAVAKGDPGRIRQVLTNLIGNAIKFTQEGEIVVRATRVDLAGAEAVVRLEVCDTGDGIGPDKLDLIFQPFVQADSSTSRKYGGTGLGLAISAQLVTLMGGSCGVSSELGAGSTFWFTIRVQVDADASAGDQDLLLPDAELAGVSVLIVDDNATQRSVLYDILADWGMTVSTAASGSAALAALRSATADGRPVPVVLLDRFMPAMDGLELARSIAADPALSPHMVLMTSLADEAEGGPTREEHICATLSKPVHREGLRACLGVALGLAGTDANLSGLLARPPSSSVGPKPERQLGRLLLAEDNLINQKVAVAMLSNAGYHVDTVLNGTAAVQALAARRYDAVLMDCQMPELNGYEATAAIRASEGSERHTPIIAMTAGARQEDRDRCLAEGMDSYLSKPVSKDALLGLVAQMVKGRPVIPVP